MERSTHQTTNANAARALSVAATARKALHDRNERKREPALLREPPATRYSPCSFNRFACARITAIGSSAFCPIKPNNWLISSRWFQ